MTKIYLSTLILFYALLSTSCSQVSTSSQKPTQRDNKTNYLTEKYKKMRQLNWNGYTETSSRVDRKRSLKKRRLYPDKKIPLKKKIEKVPVYLGDQILLDQNVTMMCFKKRFGPKKCSLLKAHSQQFCHRKSLIKNLKLYQRCIAQQAKLIN